MSEIVEHVQTKREIKEILSRAGLRPRKRFGQHFLIDGNMMRRMVESAEIEASDVVLEVGAGTGGLTDLLVRRAGNVIAMEIDRDLHAMLRDRFESADNLHLILGDVLTGKHELASEVSEAIVRATPARGGGMKLVANLPYNVATPLLMNLLVDYPQVRRFVFTVQAEVGERMTASSGTKTFGPLAILSQSLCSIETVARLGPQFFWPEPEVDSVLMKMDVGPFPFASRVELMKFVQFVRGVFEHRRKTLRSALGYIVENEVRDLICEKFDCTRRPEAISLDEWRRIFAAKS